MKCELLTSTANIQNYAHPGVMAWGRILASQLQGGRGSEGDGDSPEEVHVAPAAKTPQTSQDRNVLAMFWARPRWTMWRSRRGEAPSLVTAVYYDCDQAVTVSCVMLRLVNEPS